MSTKIFVNLPVKDLNKSIVFFTKLGFKFNPQFTDEKATCMIISDESFVMLVTEPYFRTFIKKEISDSRKTAEAIMGISAESREKVDKMADTALKAGGTKSMDPSDLGFMYSRSFQDPDGHLWDVFYMDMSQFPK